MQSEEHSKYRRWYDELMGTARAREIPRQYTEMHHVLPKSLGGSNADHNLVRLTYREHFLAHWLLCKLHTGKELQKMRFALLAMTLKSNGERITASWQFEVAKRAVADMRMTTSSRRRIAAVLAAADRRARWRPELEREARQFLDGHKKRPVQMNGRRSRRPRPSKRQRTEAA